MSDLIELKALLQKEETKTKAKPKKRERVKSFIPDLQVDFSKDPAELILPCTLARQAKSMGWYVDEVRNTNSRMGLYERLPMICKAEECYWAAMCPTANTDPPFMFKGLRCPLEVIEIFKSFASYIRELKIEPNDYVDLQMVADLVRMDLQLSRIDQELQVYGMTTNQVVGVAQAISTPIKDKLTNPLLKDQMKIRADRTKTYKELIATRADILAARQNEKKDQLNALSILDKMRQKAEDLRKMKIANIEIIESEPLALEAHVEEDDDEDNKQSFI